VKYYGLRIYAMHIRGSPLENSLFLEFVKIFIISSTACP
ncbi:unnamed protein product, partial [marine sediment metagenome]